MHNTHLYPLLTNPCRPSRNFLFIFFILYTFFFNLGWLFAIKTEACALICSDLNLNLHRIWSTSYSQFLYADATIYYACPCTNTTTIERDWLLNTAYILPYCIWLTTSLRLRECSAIVTEKKSFSSGKKCEWVKGKKSEGLRKREAERNRG